MAVESKGGVMNSLADMVVVELICILYSDVNDSR